jgi:hypothetical protein
MAGGCDCLAHSWSVTSYCCINCSPSSHKTSPAADLGALDAFFGESFVTSELISGTLFMRSYPQSAATLGSEPYVRRGYREMKISSQI